MDRCDIHDHTRYSNLRLRDALATPEQLINRALELGLKGISISDHEALSGHIKANQYAQKIKEQNPDFKVMLGNEIYLVDERPSEKHWHFVLTAKDAIGHHQLRELSSIAWLNCYTTKRMTRVDTLKSDLERIYSQNPNHLIASSACIGSELGYNILELTDAENKGDKNRAVAAYNNICNFIDWCKKLFKDDFYIEVQPGISVDQIVVNKRLRKIGKYFGIKLIPTSDAHYLSTLDASIHKAFLNSENKEREVDSFYKDAYLHSNEEMIEKFAKSGFEQSFVEELFKNSMEIYDKVQDFSLAHSQQVPKVDVPIVNKAEPPIDLSNYPVLSGMYKSDDNMDRYWVNTCIDKLRKINKFNKVYLDELEEEADVKQTIGKKLNTNMFAYPICLAHYIDLIWDCGSTIGVGRGSACSALNHYLLGITQLDPITHDFPFFRYMNRDTEGLGDIDIDVCPSKVQDIISKIREERGKKFNASITDPLIRNSLGAAYVCTFGSESSKSAVLTACFKKGTLVKTSNGEKEIQNLTSNDFVFTTNGWEKVIAPTKMNWNGNFIKVQGNYGFEDEIICTDNHEFLVLSKDSEHKLSGKINNEIINKLVPNYKQLTDSKKNKYRNYIRDIEPKWVQAKDLKEKDYVLSKLDLKCDDIEYISWKTKARSNSIFIKNRIEINNNFCELLGIWLAEGSINKNMFSFTISSEELELKNRIIYLMSDVFGLTNSCIMNRDNHSIVIQYTSADLRDFIYTLFKIEDYSELNQWNKYIPEQLLNISPQKQLQIFKGWIMGDGTYRIRNNQKWSGSQELKGTTVSRQLCLDMKRILHRNYINPSIVREKRENKTEVYNIILSGKVANKIGEVKYGNYDKELIIEWDDRLGKDLPCIYNNNLYMRYQVKSIEIIENNNDEEVYCLMVPSQNFTLSDIIVHNCRGYRSEEYPNGIDVDIAQYLSSLIPSERGFVWSINDVVFGNEDKNRKPCTPFINEVEQYPGLLDIIIGIEGCISRRGRHASGVLFMGEDPFEFTAFMKTPSGEIVTQYDLHDAEWAGAVKMDILVTEIQDKIVQSIKLMQEDNIIEPELTIREAYEKYLHPDVLPMDDPDTWSVIQRAASLDLFQLDSDIGRQGAKKIKPENIWEMSSVNGLIRLMTAEKGQETWLDKYVRYKNVKGSYEKDIEKYGLTEEELKTFSKYVGTTLGIGISQEQFMKAVMDANICGFTLKEANKARKVISKKKMNEIPVLKNQIFSKAINPRVANYVWDYIVAPGLGYSFSDIHSVSYSYIGFQSAYIATHWNSLYWNTACLIVNSGALDNDDEEEDDEDENLEVKEKDKSTNYGKVASAIGAMTKQGIKISLLDINKSTLKFRPLIETNEILFGFKGASNINNDTVDKIIKGRPYVNLKDFLNRCPLTKTIMISLIKGGAFDRTETWANNFKEPRKAIMAYYISLICEPKNKLTLSNFNGLLQRNLIPSSLSNSIQAFSDNISLKNSKFIAREELIERYPKMMEKIDYVDGVYRVDQALWKKIYDSNMLEAKEWIKANQQSVLEELNSKLFMECWEKYASGTISSWEMESLCFYYHEHELNKVDKNKYGIVDFFSLNEESEIESYFRIKGKDIPKYKISKIVGTVISKNDIRSSINLLTPTGVVSVKFTKEYYAMFNRQLSQKGEDGVKHIVEKGWFKRGTKVMCVGYRRADTFVCKTYKDTNSHQLYKIIDVKDDGTIILTHERAEE